MYKFKINWKYINNTNINNNNNNNYNARNNRNNNVIIIIILLIPFCQIWKKEISFNAEFFKTSSYIDLDNPVLGHSEI